MNQNQQTAPFPIEFGIMMGLVLGLSGQFPAAVVALISWFVLRRVRPATPGTILLVTAITVAKTLLAGFAMFIGFVSFTLAAEVIVVLAINLLLFFTHARHWAYILLIHAGYVVVMRSLELYHGSVEQQFQRLFIGEIAVRILISWLLILFIRRPSPAAGGTPDTLSDEAPNA
jgi:hypothetical protein